MAMGLLRAVTAITQCRIETPLPLICSRCLASARRALGCIASAVSSAVSLTLGRLGTPSQQRSPRWRSVTAAVYVAVPSFLGAVAVVVFPAARLRPGWGRLRGRGPMIGRKLLPAPRPRCARSLREPGRTFSLTPAPPRCARPAPSAPGALRARAARGNGWQDPPADTPGHHWSGPHESR